MLDTEEEDCYLIALWPFSSSEHRANASIVPERCLLTSSAFLSAPTDVSLPESRMKFQRKESSRGMKDLRS